jgi:hypothetical protein
VIAREREREREVTRMSKLLEEKASPTESGEIGRLVKDRKRSDSTTK